MDCATRKILSDPEIAEEIDIAMGYRSLYGNDCDLNDE